MGIFTTDFNGNKFFFRHAWETCFYLLRNGSFGLPPSLPGNYTQAVDDIQECLKLQVKLLDTDSRLLAETHYQLGVTYSLNFQYSQAIEELKRSISVIKNRLGKQGTAAP